MKTLTVRQPYAQMIVWGVKHYETRSWSTKYRGGLMIHAGKAWQKAERELCQHPDIQAVLDAHETAANDLVRGAIIGFCNVVDVIPVEDLGEIDRLERQLGFYQPGNYAWLLDGAKTIDPVPAKGSQGFWEWLPEK